jgi:hypothetical protein
LWPALIALHIARPFLDGVNAGPAAVVPSGSPPHLGNSGSFTVELWFKTEQRHFDHYGTVRAFSLSLVASQRIDC